MAREGQSHPAASGRRWRGTGGVGTPGGAGTPGDPGTQGGPAGPAGGPDKTPKPPPNVDKLAAPGPDAESRDQHDAQDRPYAPTAVSPTIGSMLLSVIGAGPAYTDRPGATGAAYLLRADGSSLLLDLGQGSFARLAGLVDPTTIDAIVISHLHPDHFIDLVPLRHYLRYERRPARVRVAGPAGLADRLDALHVDPGFSAVAFDIEPLAEGSFDVGPFRVDVAPGDPHGRELRVPRLARRSTRTGRPRLLRAIAAGRRTSMSSSDRATRCCPRSRSDRVRSSRARSISMARLSGISRTRVGAGRVLLTHLQMGYDRGATVESVRRRYDGGRSSSSTRASRRRSGADPAVRVTAFDRRRSQNQNDRGTPPEVERPGRTPLGVAAHTLGRLGRPAGRPSPRVRTAGCGRPSGGSGGGPAPGPG